MRILLAACLLLLLANPANAAFHATVSVRDHQLVLTFNEWLGPWEIGAPTADTPLICTDYSTHPYTLQLSLFDTRGLDLSAATAAAGISSVYQLITLDDAMHRLAVELTVPAAYTVTTAANTLTIDFYTYPVCDPNPRYSLRTATAPWGETIGVWEEDLAAAGSEPRQLQGEDGFVIEADQFLTRKAAKAQQAKLAKHLPDLLLLIEQRSSTARPAALAP